MTQLALWTPPTDEYTALSKQIAAAMLPHDEWKLAYAAGKVGSDTANDDHAAYVRALVAMDQYRLKRTLETAGKFQQAVRELADMTARVRESMRKEAA